MLGKGRLRMLVALCWLFLSVTCGRAGEFTSADAVIHLRHYIPSSSSPRGEAESLIGQTEVMARIMSYILICT